MSDHVSGPRALSNPIADITDVYAFPSPERPGCLVMVMNTLPVAQPSQTFSDGLVYRFRVRPLAAGSDGVPFVPRPEESRFDCVFSAPFDGDGAEPLEQEGMCITPGDESVSFRVGDEQGGGGRGVR